MFTHQGLTFREVEPDDLAMLREQRNVWWQGYRNPYPVMTMHNQQEWYRSLGPENLAFIAIAPGERTPIGLLRISQLDHENRCASLVGCDVFPHARGNGYAAKIMRAAAEWLILDLGYHRVKGECMPGNEAMAKALRTAGFTLEGSQRERIWRAGKWHDFDQYSILEGEL